jgi:hypothetical protein
MCSIGTSLHRFTYFAHSHSSHLRPRPPAFYPPIFRRLRSPLGAHFSVALPFVLSNRSATCSGRKTSFHPKGFYLRASASSADERFFAVFSAPPLSSVASRGGGCVSAAKASLRPWLLRPVSSSSALLRPMVFSVPTVHLSSLRLSDSSSLRSLRASLRPLRLSGEIAFRLWPFHFDTRAPCRRRAAPPSTAIFPVAYTRVPSILAVSSMTEAATGISLRSQRARWSSMNHPYGGNPRR